MSRKPLNNSVLINKSLLFRSATHKLTLMKWNDTLRLWVTVRKFRNRIVVIGYKFVIVHFYYGKYCWNKFLFSPFGVDDGNINRWKFLLLVKNEMKWNKKKYGVHTWSWLDDIAMIFSHIFFIYKNAVIITWDFYFFTLWAILRHFVVCMSNGEKSFISFFNSYKSVR